MRRTVLLFGLTLVGGIAVGVLADRVLHAQQPPVMRTMLQQRDIEGMAGREAILYRAEFIPGGVAGKHYHPGPEVGYILEGTLILEPEGMAPLTLKAGDSFYNPPKHRHNAKNGSATEPVKVLVFLLGEKGQPLATAAK